ncbi:MAG: DinB family protein [Planctomycetes bacterium]|nr:DinB family protein [Planctomycetota bacterium]
MNWKAYLEAEIASAYQATSGLIARVRDEDLEFKPASGANWMTVGQLLMHITSACGACCQGFVTGDWGMPEDFDPANAEPGSMLPPAEALPTVSSVAQARELLENDRQLALAMIERAGDDALANQRTSPPWNPTEELVLGHHLAQMVGHLINHKTQLFFYLKLMGQDVNTFHLYGMAP